MGRPKHEYPTPAELRILQLLWERGPLTVREVLEAQDEPRAYTSVMSLLNVMAEKGLLQRQPQGRAFLYRAKVPRDRTLGRMVSDLWQRAFEGSTSTLVAKLLEESNPTQEELDAIRRTIRDYESRERSS
jgi:predicted transcriptional regulator